MKSQPGLPSIIVVSMCVSTTIACVWMRAARTAGVSADAGLFAGACAESDTTDSSATTTTAFLFSMVFPPALLVLLESGGHGHIRRRHIRDHPQHLVVRRHEGAARFSRIIFLRTDLLREHAA